MGDLPVECESNSVSIESNRLYVQRWQVGKRNAGGERTEVDVRLLRAQFRDPRGGWQLLLDVGARGVVGDRVGECFVRRVGSVLRNLKTLRRSCFQATGRRKHSRSIDNDTKTPRLNVKEDRPTKPGRKPVTTNSYSVLARRMGPGGAGAPRGARDVRNPKKP